MATDRGSVSRGAEIPDPTTLRVLSGMPSAAASLADSTLIMIDCQNTYTQGVCPVSAIVSNSTREATRS